MIPGLLGNNLVIFEGDKGSGLAVNNLVYFRTILVGPMIVIVFWGVEINLVYFAQKRWLICDCDSFLGY